MDSAEYDMQIEHFGEDEEFEKIIPPLRSHFKRISQVMDAIGVEMATRKEWEMNIVKELFTMLTDMESELNQKKTQLVDLITKTMTETRQIGKELHLPNLPNLNGSMKPLQIMLEEARSEHKCLLLQRDNVIKQITAAQEREQQACAQLERSPKGIWNKSHELLPTEAELADFEQFVDKLEQELFEKQEEFFTLKSEIQKNAKLLNFSPLLNFQSDVLNGDERNFKFSDSNMHCLRTFYQDLAEQKEKLAHQIQDLRSKLQTLWELLEINPHERSVFLKNYTDNNMDTLQALKDEVKKLEEQKQQNIEKFLAKFRQDLNLIWDLCLMSDQQRSSFQYFNNELCTEDILEIHELEVNKWKQFYEKNKELYLLIDKRISILQKLEKLNEDAQNPERYKNRGGKLLKEEQERKAAETSLPKVEKKITELAELYEDEYSRPFTVFGVDVKRVIADRLEQLHKEKQLKLSARKQQQQATLTTPSRYGMGPTPRKTPSGMTPRTPRAMSTCKKNLLAPFSTGGSTLRVKNTRTAPSKVNLSGKISKQSRLSLERGKKIKSAIKYLSISSKKENDPSILNVTQTKEYREFISGSKFTRSTMFIEAENKDLGAPSISPLAKPLPKSPYLHRAGRSPLKANNGNKFEAKSKGFDELF